MVRGSRIELANHRNSIIRSHDFRFRAPS